MNAPVITLLAIGLFLTAMALQDVTEQAMKVCELSHSHDVCFQTLNR